MLSAIDSSQEVNRGNRFRRSSDREWLRWRGVGRHHRLGFLGIDSALDVLQRSEGTVRLAQLAERAEQLPINAGNRRQAANTLPMWHPAQSSITVR